MLGMTYLQSGANVSEVSISTTTFTYSPSSSITQVGSSSSSSSTGVTTSTGSSTPTYYGPTGVLGVSLTDPPIVPPGVTNVYISYSSVEVHVSNAGNDDGWYQVADSGSVDLMSLINVSLTLGSAEVQTGIFNLIAFNITSAAITMNGANVTAYVPANRISVPIVGGIAVSAGNSSGVLVDLSPEVVPYQNGTSISYVLVPEAKSLPIPHSVWNNGLEIKGARLQEVQNQTWVNNATGQVVVTNASISQNSFSLTLQNQGNQNASFSSIVIGQVVSLPECLVTAAGGASRPAYGNGSYVSLRSLRSYYSGNQTVYLRGQVNPVPAFPNTTALVVVTDPNGAVVESLNATVQFSGVFYAIFVAGGLVTPWVNGIYNVTAYYNGAEGTTSFEWGPAIVTSTTSSSSYNYTTSSIYSENTTVSTTTMNSLTSTIVNSTTALPPANLTVMTNGTSYFGNQSIQIYGSLTPPPMYPNFTLNIRVISPQRVTVFNGMVQVTSDGTFSLAFPAGGMPNGNTFGGNVWTNGTYLVYALHERLVAYTKFQWSGPSPVVAFNTTSITTSNWTNFTSSFNNTYSNPQNSTGQVRDAICGLLGDGDTSKLPPSFSVAYYAILSNGTLYPVNYTSLVLSTLGSHGYYNSRGDDNRSSSMIGNGMLTFTLAPGQSVTFTYNGKVDSLTGTLLTYLPRNFAVPSSIFQINPGQEYTVLASGPFDTRIATVVNATSS
jgi:hypothetical protein